MVNEKEFRDEYSTLRVIIFAQVLGVPVLTLAFVCFVFQFGPGGRARSDDPLFYFFLALGALLWALIPVVERKIMSAYRAGEVGGRQLLAAAKDVVLVRFMIIGSIYIIGLITTLSHGTFARLAYFYVLGILYTIWFWPSEARFRRIVEQLEAK